MNEIFYGTKVLLLFGAIACVLVVVAMMADLVAGVYKSKMRGEYAQSELLKRTGYKFCLYEGSMLIALCVDVLIHFTHIYEYIGFPHVMFSLPLLTFLMAIFWCAVEYPVNQGKGIGKSTFAYRQGGKACKHDVHEGGISEYTVSGSCQGEV